MSLPIALNGWQRLWIVISVLWLVPVLGVSFALWPPVPALPERLQVRMLSPEQLHAKPTTAKLSDIDVEFMEAAHMLAQTAPPGLSRDEFHAFVHNYLREQALTVYRNDVRKVHQQRLKFACIVIAVWSLPVAVLYALGWAVAWIRRGFSSRD